jgi:hypothetical protein
MPDSGAAELRHLSQPHTTLRLTGARCPIEVPPFELTVPEPEPEQYAMLVVGLGLLAWRLSSRSR